MSAKKVNKAVIEIFVFVAALFVLLLTVVNIDNYKAPQKVLAVETQINSDDKFWEDFLTKNPDYIPGWLEEGRIDKVNEIDPNYLLPQD